MWARLWVRTWRKNIVACKRIRRNHHLLIWPNLTIIICLKKFNFFYYDYNIIYYIEYYIDSVSKRKFGFLCIFFLLGIYKYLIYSLFRLFNDSWYDPKKNVQCFWRCNEICRTQGELGSQMWSYIVCLRDQTSFWVFFFFCRGCWVVQRLKSKDCKGCMFYSSRCHCLQLCDLNICTRGENTDQLYWIRLDPFQVPTSQLQRLDKVPPIMLPFYFVSFPGCIFLCVYKGREK